MIVATFIGPDETCGFKYGNTYTLEEPSSQKHEWKIMVEDIRDTNLRCSYNTVEEFLSHWDVLICV